MGQAVRCLTARHYTLSPVTLSPQDLIILYRGGDPDSERMRKSAARYVGLEMPVSTPLAQETTPEAFATKYADSIAARVGDLSQLQGLDHLKAQLYGADFREDKAASEGTGAYKPLHASSAPSAEAKPFSLRDAITTGPGPVAPRGVRSSAAQAATSGAPQAGAPVTGVAIDGGN